jgi:hypothetical protein
MHLVMDFKKPSDMSPHRDSKVRFERKWHIEHHNDGITTIKFQKALEKVRNKRLIEGRGFKQGKTEVII